MFFLVVLFGSNVATQWVNLVMQAMLSICRITLIFQQIFRSMYVISVSNKQISNKAQVKARLIKGKASNVMIFYLIFQQIFDPYTYQISRLAIKYK